MRRMWRHTGFQPQASRGHGPDLVGGAAEVNGKIAERLMRDFRLRRIERTARQLGAVHSLKPGGQSQGCGAGDTK